MKIMGNRFRPHVNTDQAGNKEAGQDIERGLLKDTPRRCNYFNDNFHIVSHIRRGFILGAALLKYGCIFFGVPAMPAAAENRVAILRNRI